MGLDDFDYEVKKVEIDTTASALYKVDTIQEYSFECPNCGNEIDRETSGEYYPKGHICRKCMTPIWVWPEGNSSWSDDMIVKEI